MPYCPSCGESIEEEYRFCGQCGYQLRDDLPPLTQTHDGFLSPDVILAFSESESGGMDRDEAEKIVSQLEEDLQNMLMDLWFVLSKIGLFSFASVVIRDKDLDTETLSQKERAQTFGAAALAAYADRTWGENLDQVIKEGYNLADGNEASPKSTNSSNSSN